MAERLEEWYNKCTKLFISPKIKRFLNYKWEFANGNDTHNAEAFVQKYSSKEGWTPYMDGETVAENVQQMQVVFKIETAQDTVSCQLINNESYTLDTRPVNIGGDKFKLRYRVYRAQPEEEHKLVSVKDLKTIGSDVVDDLADVNMEFINNIINNQDGDIINNQDGEWMFKDDATDDFAVA